MSSLHDLERDVHQFLHTLANVRKVDVAAFSVARGRKKATVTVFIDPDTKENRDRVYLTEQYLMDRHRSVLFDFHCHWLKEDNEQESAVEASK